MSSLHVEWLLNPRVHDLDEEEEGEARINNSNNTLSLLFNGQNNISDTKFYTFQ